MAGEIEPVEYYENPVLTKSGKERIAAWHNTLLKDEAGKIIGTLSSGEDITERKKAEEALTNEAIRRRVLIDQSRDGIVVLDQDGKVYEANQRYAEMLGYSAEEVRQLHVWDWDAQWTREQLLEMIRLVDAAGDHFETRHRRKDGTFYDVEISTNGAVLGGRKLVFCVCRDISERKKAEEALRESEERYKALYDDAPVGYHGVDREGMFTRVNRTEADLLGYSPEEMIGKYVWEFVPEDQKELSKKSVRKKIRQKKAMEGFERKIVCKDGKQIDTYIVDRLILDKNGKVLGTRATMQDITERKRAEEALQKRTYDLGKRIKELNCLYSLSKLVEYPGVSLEELYEGAIDLITRAWQYPDITCARITLKEKEFKTDNFKRTKWKQSAYIKIFGKRTGKVEVFYLEKRPFLKEEKYLIDAIAERLGDATERKQAEEALREREELNFALFKYNPVQTIVVDLEGGITKCNLAKRKSGDRLPEIGDVMYMDYAGKHQIDMHAELMECIRTGETKEFSELKYGDKVLSITIAPFPKGAIIASLDITERKWAEEALRESEERYKGLSEVTIEGILIHDKGVLVDANSAFVEMFGYEIEELKGKNIIDLLAYPDSKDAIREKIAGEITTPHELLAYRKDGTIFPLELEAREVRYKGKVLRVTAVRDITERKLAEEALKESERRYKELYDEAPVGYHEIDREGKITRVNQTEAALLGYTPEEITGKYVWEFMPEDQQELSKISIRKKIGQKKAVEGFERKYVCKDGKQIDVYIIDRLLLDKDGEVTSIRSALEDITERKRAEEELIKVREQVENYLYIAGVMIATIDDKENITMMNKKGYEILCYKEGELIGKNWFDTLIPERIREEIRGVYNQLMSGDIEPVEYYENQLLTKDGEERIIAFNNTVLRNPDNKITGILLSGEDITERKKVEEALKAEHSKLETRLRHESLLAEIASSLNSAGSFQDIMGELIARIGKTMGVDSAGFYRFDVNCEAANRFDTWNSYSGQQKLEFPQVIPCSRISNFCQQLKANESVILSNVSESEVKEKDFFANSDLKALIICPLSIVNQFKGFVCFVYQHEHIWSPEEINIYKTISDMIASAWERDSQFHARLEAEKKHTETIRLAEKTWRLASIGVMAAGITHEINQPLSIIKITADSMILWDEDNKRVLPGKLLKSLVRISDNVTRIDRIIRQMRYFGKSPDKTALETIDLNESVKNAVSLISRQLLSHEINLQIDLEDASLPIQGNRIHLEQIVINLVTNAIQALDTCENKDKIIKITSSRAKISAILKVEDNGPGFTEEVGNKIFDPFFSTKRSTGGTGLGLAIVKSFVYGFGGSIGAENNKTSGATFIVRFPISQST